MKTRETTLYAKYIKGVIDRTAAIIFIVLFWWLYLICALMVIVDSGFPVIYKQKRVGKKGKPFYIYKYRTMVKNADKIGSTSTEIGDLRITRAGSILRKTSLDEIPQMINIIQGTMSFIGYRPDVVHEDNNYSYEKYLFKPGITGLAQVNGRSTLTPKEKLDWENLYSYKASFLFDIKIIIKTISVVLKRKGTN